MLDARITKQLRDYVLDISLSVAAGEILVLMGSNGSGKSTSLNCIAGLLAPDSGCIRLNGTALFEPLLGTNLAIEERRIGYVFQNTAVFPHLTVRENIAYGPRARGISRREWAGPVDDLIDRMQIADLASVKAGNLSGGQKQRVALARALAIRPSLLLLDEPFTALDAGSTRIVKELTRKSVASLKIPCIVVTHRSADAEEIGDRICVLCSGKKEWEGSPRSLPKECAACRCPDDV
jgi:molybdate transport system ATP-binding protein